MHTKRFLYWRNYLFKSIRLHLMVSKFSLSIGANEIVKFLFIFKDDHLLVGTRQGHLLMYSVLQGNNTESSSSSRCEVHLLRSNKYFAKKPIQQLAVVPEHQILISLSGNCLFK